MDTQPGIGGPTSSMKDLTDKLAYLRLEVLSKYNVGELGQTWYAKSNSGGINTNALPGQSVSFVMHSNRSSYTSPSSNLWGRAESFNSRQT